MVVHDANHDVINYGRKANILTNIASEREESEIISGYPSFRVKSIMSGGQRAGTRKGPPDSRFMQGRGNYVEQQHGRCRSDTWGTENEADYDTGILVEQAFHGLVSERTGTHFAAKRIYPLVQADVAIRLKLDVEWLRWHPLLSVFGRGCGFFFFWPSTCFVSCCSWADLFSRGSRLSVLSLDSFTPRRAPALLNIRRKKKEKDTSTESDMIRSDLDKAKWKHVELKTWEGLHDVKCERWLRVLRSGRLAGQVAVQWWFCVVCESWWVSEHHTQICAVLGRRGRFPWQRKRSRDASRESAVHCHAVHNVLHRTLRLTGGSQFSGHEWTAFSRLNFITEQTFARGSLDRQSRGRLHRKTAVDRIDDAESEVAEVDCRVVPLIFADLAGNDRIVWAEKQKCVGDGVFGAWQLYHMYFAINSNAICGSAHAWRDTTQREGGGGGQGEAGRSEVFRKHISLGWSRARQWSAQKRALREHISKIWEASSAPYWKWRKMSRSLTYYERRQRWRDWAIHS